MYHSYQKKLNLRFAQGESEVRVLITSLEILIWIIQERPFVEKFGKTFGMHLQSINFNPFQPSVVLYIQTSVAFHIEISHLLCSAKEMTGFFMKCNTGAEMGCATFVCTFKETPRNS